MNCRVLFNFIIKRHAGHSKWANIKHIKAAKDAERSAMFTKLSRQMKVAAQGMRDDHDRDLNLTAVKNQIEINFDTLRTIENIFVIIFFQRVALRILLQISGYPK